MCGQEWITGDFSSMQVSKTVKTDLRHVSENNVVKIAYNNKYG